MPERTLIARVREDDSHSGTLLVTSPVVGVVDGAPSAGVFLNRFDEILTVRVMGLRHVLRMPRDKHGWVVEVHIPNQLTPVAFDAPLLRIAPHIVGLEEAEGVAQAGGTDDDAGDAIVIKAPTEGIFYRRPSPDAAAFVEVGARVGGGTTLGLVEVMKCFNQITYGGPGLPDEGIVSRVLVEDATEVHFGQPLFWIRPAK
jgi:acetyl-CoA carboxylase biotin carboxyl carrier protein